ncbi:uncharacterized protein FIBRA_08592 [Fibroporia radiculosa]|uniref:Uncharacterized protein n=1 Tax=Fibroporia radiculosa TaxID=599839 RepID=J4GHS5_9APHY|nr:uncharacterized protein FIBRA_08592 [Fibroporia radiculosa]CCM06338.1 predicted protein [Fibroporia radiculosa]
MRHIMCGCMRALLLVTLLSFVSAQNVTWMSPSAGDVYASGDMIAGRWSVDGTQEYSSPSFRLCPPDAEQASGGCGAAVWPTVEQDGGSYLIYMSLPDVSDSTQFVLQMAGTTGETSESPAFSLVPVNSRASPGSTKVTTNTTHSPPDSLASPSLPSSNSSATPLPNYAETTMPAPTAAYAVPLALVGSVIVAATGLRPLAAVKRDDRGGYRAIHALSGAPARRGDPQERV